MADNNKSYFSCENMDEVTCIADFNCPVDDDVIMEEDFVELEANRKRASRKTSTDSDIIVDSDSAMPSAPEAKPMGSPQDNSKKRRSSDPLEQSKDARLAERKKQEGNEAYRNRDYAEAAKLYTRAIELVPDCAPYYSNRSACHMMLGQYRPALEDAQTSTRLDPAFVKGWQRVGKCHVAMGAPSLAISVLQKALALSPQDPNVLQELSSAQALQGLIESSTKAAEKKEHRAAIFHLDQALRIATGATELRIRKAEYLTFLNRLSEAEDIVNDILMRDSNQVDALYVRGLCRYYMDNQEVAFQHFQKVLRLDADHSRAKETYKRAKLLIQKKEEGNVAFKAQNLPLALRIYSEALEIDDRNRSTNAKLFYNRATVSAKLNKLEQSIEDCSSAIQLDEGYVKAYLRRANSYQLIDKHEEAVRDFEKVYKMQKTPENKRLLQEAKLTLKKSKRKDYYKILGVEKGAGEDVIKKAYKKKALLHHPDRHSSASDAEKAEHERKFKELGEAYHVLTDPKKKALHDSGHDVNDPECPDYSSMPQDFDPNQLLENLFGGGGGFFHSSQGGHQQYFNHMPSGHGGFQGFPGGGFQFNL